MLTAVLAKKNWFTSSGGVSENPVAQPVSSELLPSGHVVLLRIAVDRSSVPNDHAPSKFASVKSAPSTEPGPNNLTRIVSLRSAPVRSAPLKSTL